MKKTAVLVYNQFCNFEIAPALEMLAMAQKPITIFTKSLTPGQREETPRMIIRDFTPNDGLHPVQRV